MMTHTARTWLPSAPWIAAATATPWVSRAASPDDPTVITLLACFVAVGVLGIPVGFALGRLGVRRTAVVVAALAVAGATLSSSVAVIDFGAAGGPGDAAVVLVTALFFAVLALPLPSVGFVIGRVRRGRADAVTNERPPRYGGM
jgi:hypothetical protein